VQPLLSPRTTRARVSPLVFALVALVAIPASVVLAWFVAPEAVIPLSGGGEQVDISQKIFYLHVPVAMAAYWGFAVGAWNALLYLLRDDSDYDIRSYAGVHVGMVFGTLVLVTGSIWARAAWGVWWQWGDRQLLVFLTLYLFYGSWFMVRFSIDAGRHREVVSAVLALVGVVLVPLSFLAIRIADTLIHPVVLDRSGLHMTGSMAAAFLTAIAGFVALASLMVQVEVGGKLLAARGFVTRSAGTTAAQGAMQREGAGSGDRTAAALAPGAVVVRGDDVEGFVHGA
jgi:heme exporter protein C